MATNMTVLDYDVPPVADALLTDSPPEVAAQPANVPTPVYINIAICRKDNTTISFLIKKNTPFDRLMKTYCVTCKLPVNGVRLMFKGIQIKRTDTPSSLEMEDGDSLDALHDCE